MTSKTSEIIPEAIDSVTATQPVPRLCNEIQLFDLCDRSSCSSKSGRFCTDTDLLLRFEKIEEQESRIPDPEPSEEWDDEHDGGFDEQEHDDDLYDEDFYDDEE